MKHKNNQGFSLVELLIAIAILALIMVALASFMGTTTNSYVRSRNDRELQQAGQETFDMIADKLMQARLVRIGTDTKEYAAVGSCNSIGVGADFALLDSSGAPIVADYGNRSRYSFDALTETTITSSNPLSYIAVLYDQKLSDGTYGEAIDIFCFSGSDIYLFRRELPKRPSSYNDGHNANADKTLSDLETTLDSEIRSTLIRMGSASVEDYFLCDTLKHEDAASAVTIYAIPDENSLYLTMDFEKQGMENRTEGMVTIRNSYVLQPRKLPGAAGSGSSSSGTPTP